jgi:hypothetical protein
MVECLGLESDSAWCLDVVLVVVLEEMLAA